MAERRLVVTCEHGGYRIPPACVPLFSDAVAVLQDHRGWDKGAAQLAEQLGDAFGVKPHVQTMSRLVIDNNRSLTNRALFSPYTRSLPPVERERLLNRHYLPHRRRIEAEIAAELKTGPVLHVAVHSFTPVLKGVVRNADIGLLYDPKRKAEREVVEPWKRSLEQALPGMRVRLNYPYKGISDGLTTALRKKFGARYAGIELELNQKHHGTPAWLELEREIIDTLAPFVARAAI